MDEEKLLDDDVHFVLTEAFILYSVVEEWQLGDNFNPKIYKAAYEDLLERLCLAGHIGRRADAE